MYQDRLVVAVKHNGRVLREQGETVFLPYGCEYSLHFKNLNSVRALVRVSVDGQDATKGTSLIVPANGSIDLERFLEAGQMDKGHKFKFIERTQKIEDGPRGIQAEDGLIRIEFEFERVAARIEDVYIKRHYIDDHRWYKSPHGPFWNYTSGTTFSSTSALHDGQACSDVSYSANSVTAQNASFSNTSASTVNLSNVTRSIDRPKSEVGITVPGSQSDQKFTQGAWFPTDGVKHVMVLKLLGQVGETKVEQPVTVKTKTECPTCGTKNKFGTKFCRECGTSLQLL